MNKTIEGKSNIKATVICDSCSANSSVNGKRITTFEIEFPRIILSEFNTHRALSRSSASSRAIPFDKMLKQLNGKPVRFGAANQGMQDKGEDFDSAVMVPGCSNISWEYIFPNSPEEAWEVAKDSACSFAGSFKEAGYHKQIYNRLLEPFQMIKTIATATDWNNFFWLRLDEAADPTIQELARCMKQAMDESNPQTLSPGEWHLPLVGFGYVHPDVYSTKKSYYFIDDNNSVVELTLEQAQKVSAARCAAISFRNEDYGLEKCLQVYDRLVGGERKHSSALEHIAMPMRERTIGNEDDNISSVNDPMFPYTWEKGITHMDKEEHLWSGNFCGFIQYRQLIPNESKKG